MALAETHTTNSITITSLVALFNEGRYLEAEDLARTITTCFPGYGFGWNALGAVLLQMGKSVDALEPLQKAATLLPDDAVAHFNLGITLRNLANLGDAETSFRRALEINSDYVEAQGNLGNILKDLGRLEEAKIQYSHALEINPDYAEVHNNLGAIFQDLGWLDKAESSFRRALEINPDFAEAHNNLGAIFQDLGRLVEAEASYRHALEVKPDFAEAHNNLGSIFQDLERVGEAETSFRRSLEIKPDYTEAQSNLANLLMRQGLHEEALALFERALTSNPKHNKVKLMLCQALYALSLVEYEKAKQAACRVKQLFHDDPIVYRGISGIIGEIQTSTVDTQYSRILFNNFANKFESTLYNLDYCMPGSIDAELGLENIHSGCALDVLDAGCGTGLCGVFLRPLARTLVGVDVSDKMLRKAKDKNIYDYLYEDTVVNVLRRNKAAFDLIVSADMLPYIGDIRDLAESLSYALRRNGVLAISAECGEHDESNDAFSLQPSGRYQHSAHYLHRTLEDAGISVEKITYCTVRMENGKPVPGCIVLSKIMSDL
jgi:predicted TPR repeat methyltransferase